MSDALSSALHAVVEGMAALARAAVQLKRFEYDPMTDRMVKINDRFEFSDKLDVRTRRCSPHTCTTRHRSVTRTRIRARAPPGQAISIGSHGQ